MSAEALTEPALLKVLESVQDPDLGRSIVALGMIKEVKIEAGGETLAFTCELTTPACPVKEKIEKEIREAVVRAFPSVKKLDLKMTGKVRGAALVEGQGENLIPQIKNVILIGAGKGGVGKSTAAVNLAVALRRLGARVALLDLDIYAPALPQLLGKQEKPKLQGEHKILPLIAHGLEAMSMGFLVEPKQAMIWRGHILQGIVAQFLRDVVWSEADYLVVDLPPGSAEVTLALAQSCPAAGAVLLSTPQEASLGALLRAKLLFEQLRLPVLGLLENRTGTACPACGKGYSSSSNGGHRSAAPEPPLPLLGEVPFDPAVGAAEAAGVPVVLGQPESAAARAIVSAAEKLAAQISIRNHAGVSAAAS